MLTIHDEGITSIVTNYRAVKDIFPKLEVIIRNRNVIGQESSKLKTSHCFILANALKLVNNQNYVIRCA